MGSRNVRFRGSPYVGGYPKRSTPQSVGDAGDLLLRQQEESAKSSEATASCLGLLTIISDYDAKLDWRFDVHSTQSESMIVTTIAILPLKNVPGASA
jgi:hypothetical protein